MKLLYKGMFAIVLASIAVVYALTSVSLYSSSVGTVKGLGVSVYWYSQCSQTVSSIDWGLAEPGAVKNVTVCIRNEGNASIMLSMQTANLNPSNAVNYISLSWNYSRWTIAKNQVLAVTLSLSISSSIMEITSFSSDIIISAV
jgi:hypothetical protein